MMEFLDDNPKRIADVALLAGMTWEEAREELWRLWYLGLAENVQEGTWSMWRKAPVQVSQLKGRANDNPDQLAP